MANELKSLTLNGKTYNSFVDQEAREKGGGGSAKGAVLYTEQTLTEEQKAQARENIGAVDETSVRSIVDNALGKANLSEYQLLGQTPQYLADENAVYDVVLDVKEETAVSITSDTVAEMAGATRVVFQGCEETVENGIHTLECKSTGAWYSVRKHFTVVGLTPNEQYTLMYDTRGVVESDTIESGYYAHIGVNDPDTTSLVSTALSIGSNIKTVYFTAKTESVVVSVYTTDSGHSNQIGYKIRYRDIWINKKSAKAIRTEVFKRDVTTSERLDLNGIKGGVTVESVPNTDVYIKLIEAEADGYLKGKKCVCFGDSITGNYAHLFDYPSVIADKTGMEVINAGFGGCRMAQHPTPSYNAFSMFSLANSVAAGDWSAQDEQVSSVASANATEHLEALKSVNWSEVDYITIFYGTNDFTGGVTIDDESNPLSTAQYKGALRHSIETILTAYPHIRIAVITPIYRFWKDGETITDSDSKEVNGLKLTDFVEAAIEVADEYKLPVFNLYNSLGINKLNRSTFLADGVHPSANGIDRIGESLAARLMSI